jgi:hypothetical protein
VKAIVVYESLWGNTAAVARAIAEGIGSGAAAFSTSEATAQPMKDVTLLVAGAPLLAFTLPTEFIRKSIGADSSHRQNPPDLSHPSMRSWLNALPAGSGYQAAFETRIWWSPGSAARRIAKALTAAGYQKVLPNGRFLVLGKYGPLKDGELDRARQWGAQLAELVERSMKGRTR